MANYVTFDLDGYRERLVEEAKRLRRFAATDFAIAPEITEGRESGVLLAKSMLIDFVIEEGD